MTEETKPTQANDSEEQNERTQQIVDLGSGIVKTRDGTIHTLTIVGQIEGHQEAPSGAKTTKYEHVLPQLVAVEENPEIDGLLVLLNTVGGDVEAGLAISELIAGMRKPTVSLVLGGGHSIGVPLAVSTDYSFIAPSATMTVHPMRMSGVVIGVMQTFRYFENMQDRIIEFVVSNSDITDAEFRKLMLRTDDMANDVGTILFAKKAVETGLIDKMGGLSDALEKLYELIEKERGK